MGNEATCFSIGQNNYQTFPILLQIQYRDFHDIPRFAASDVGHMLPMTRTPYQITVETMVNGAIKAEFGIPEESAIKVHRFFHKTAAEIRFLADIMDVQINAGHVALSKEEWGSISVSIYLLSPWRRRAA
ncbi:hypothetical protein AND_005338 [Anopheles darlingi]|uniref:Uncharacterized protein n=1 Tax=Anopheles darlingi TaxID=43151 RepID=W5JFX4_ANODA|nr:hypothetical protein AND_005338 [Anopheles darlingi]